MLDYALAIRTAEARGHTLGGFTTAVVAAGSLETGWEALCIHCGMDASVWTRGYEVRGEAVALNCPGRR
jgi:hypothetical protein